MNTFRLNPHRRTRAYEREYEGRPRVGQLMWSLFGLWCGALVLAGVGFRVEHGLWPTFPEATLLPLAYGLIALPASAGCLFGSNLVGGAVMLLFWPAMLGLHAGAMYHRRWRYVAIVAAVLLPAGWNWTIKAATMMWI